MEDLELNNKIALIQSPSLRADLNAYIDTLIQRQSILEEDKSIGFHKGFGGARGAFKMAADFDEPLEDFQYYTKK